MNKRFLPLLPAVLLSAALLARSAAAQDAAAGATAAQAQPVDLIANGNFETDANGDGAPDGWGAAKGGLTWEVEDGNHYCRLKAPAPGKMTMIYRLVPMPEGIRAVELSWRQRISELKPGKQAWFDARVMLEWKDADNKKMKGAPSPPYARKNTTGWVEKKIQFLVPEGAKNLEFMPALFQVQSGIFEIDDISLHETDTAPVEAATQARTEAYQKKIATITEKRQEKAAQNSGPEGELIANGSFEEDANRDGVPDKFSAVKGNLSWEKEGDNHFLRMTSTEPGKTVLFYRAVDIPKDTKALELKWRQRITDLKPGKQGWFDARIMLDFKNATNKKVKGGPSAPYTRKSTDGWVEKSKAFLVPEDALTLEIMPTLFQVEKGTFDLDDLSLRPTAVEPLLEAKARADEEAKFINVPAETANKANWPPELHVAGNKVLDKNNKEVLLCGVNIVSLEWNPRGERVLRNTLTAIEDWKSNIIRLPVKEQYWFDPDLGTAYRELVDNVIMLAANRGAYVLLDLHRFRAPKQKHVDFWKDAAARYKDHPAVIFDLFNEPHGISWEVWKNGGFVNDKDAPADEDAFLTAEEKVLNTKGFHSVGMQALIDAARSTGAKNIVVVGGLDWAYDASGFVKGFALDEHGGNGLMIATHIYAAKRDWAGKVLAVADKYPVIVSEFGANTQKFTFIPAEAQEDATTWVPRVFGFIQQHHFHWTAFSFHPGAGPKMLNGWDYTPTPEWGAVVKRALAGEKFPPPAELR